MKIVIDGMGGDNAPKSNVEGAVNAIKEYQVDLIIWEIKIYLKRNFQIMNLIEIN